MRPQQLAGRTALRCQPFEGRSHSAARLFDRGHGDRGFSERKVVIKRALGRPADVDDVVQSGARKSLPAEQRHRGIDDRLAMPGNSRHEVPLTADYIDWSTSASHSQAET